MLSGAAARLNLARGLDASESTVVTYGGILDLNGRALSTPSLQLGIYPLAGGAMASLVYRF